MPMDQSTEMVLARIARAKCLLGLIEKELTQPNAQLGYEECSYTIELEAICTEMGVAAQERMDELTAAWAASATDEGEGEHGCQDDFADGIPEENADSGSTVLLEFDGEHMTVAPGIPEDGELAAAARQLAEEFGAETVTFATGR
jgi:hypothetical protein